MLQHVFLTHTKTAYDNFIIVSTMGATLTFSLMISFLTLSYLMRQLIRYNIVISATLKLLSYWLFNIQDSIPHDNAGLIAIHFNHK